MKLHPLPSQEYLQECLHYNFFTGILTWKIRPLRHFPSVARMNIWNGAWAGKAAGCMHSKGYRIIRIDKRSYYKHRLVYKLVTGFSPDELLDHRNGIVCDDRLLNLRESTNGQNLCNRGAQRNNKTGLKGAWRHSMRNGKWWYQAQITKNGKRFILGVFETAEEAHQAYASAASATHGEFAKVS